LANRQMHFLALEIHKNFNLGNKNLIFFVSPYFLSSYMEKIYTTSNSSPSAPKSLKWSTTSASTLVSKMSSFVIVYTYDMGLDQLLPSKIHSNFNSSNKITKIWISTLVEIFPSPSWTSHYVPSCLFSQL